ncbi:site-specific integrase [Caballeronia sp. 15715]|uniref:site-specific integrase n=1 Tax=Caballeronia sp. 15715 TaxID=3391030 RepID=UPI0039E57DEC
MASITPILNKSGLKWKVLIRRRGEPRIGKTFDTRAEAEAFAYVAENKILAIAMPKLWPAVDRSNSLPSPEPLALPSPDPSPLSLNLDSERLADIVEKFMKRARAKQKYRCLAPTVHSEVGDATVGEINNDWVVAYIDKMRAKKTHMGTQFSYSTIKKHMTLMKKAIEWRAESLRVFCPSFPFKITDDFPRDHEQSRDRRLNAEETQRLEARLSRIKGKTRDHWVLLVEFARQTGARLQELLLAEWREFTPDGDGWTIPRNHTKSFDERCIPFGDAAKRIFKELKELADPDDPLVFHALGTSASVSSAFVKIVKEAGIKNFRFHDLRHEAVTRLAMMNPADSTSVMKISGHKNWEIFNRYVNPTMTELSVRLVLP